MTIRAVDTGVCRAARPFATRAGQRTPGCSREPETSAICLRILGAVRPVGIERIAQGKQTILTWIRCSDAIMPP